MICANRTATTRPVLRRGESAAKPGGDRGQVRHADPRALTSPDPSHPRVPTGCNCWRRRFTLASEWLAVERDLDFRSTTARELGIA
jgi:hypothetical protein